MRHGNPITPDTKAPYPSTLIVFTLLRYIAATVDSASRSMSFLNTSCNCHGTTGWPYPEDLRAWRAIPQRIVTKKASWNS